MFPFTLWMPVVLPIVLGGHHRRIIPYDMNGPFKQAMMSLFRLAWSSKIRLPLLITVAFLALDVHLQMEINVFWEVNHREIDNDDEEEVHRRRRRIIQEEQARRVLVTQLQGAPLAIIEDLDDTESEDSSSVGSSPSDTDSSQYGSPNEIDDEDELTRLITEMIGDRR